MSNEQNQSETSAHPVDTLVMFFLEKNGVYGHGVFWIGTDETEGRKQADIAASRDSDDYHDWHLCKFSKQSEYVIDAEHEIVYTGVRT